MNGEYAPNHRHTNGPRRIAYTKAQVRVVRSLILALLHVMYNFRQTFEHVGRERLIGQSALTAGDRRVGSTHSRAKDFEQWLQILRGLHLCGGGEFALRRALDILWERVSGRNIGEKGTHLVALPELPPTPSASS